MCMGSLSKYFTLPILSSLHKYNVRVKLSVTEEKNGCTSHLTSIVSRNLENLCGTATVSHSADIYIGLSEVMFWRTKL